MKIWPARSTARSKDQPQSPAAALASLLCRGRALHAFPRASERTRHLTRAAIGCCLLLTHVTGAGTPRPCSCEHSAFLRTCAAAWPQARVLRWMLRAVVGDAVADHKVAVPRCAARPPAPRCASATLPSKSFPVCEQTSPALRSRGKPGEPAVIPGGFGAICKEDIRCHELGETVLMGGWGLSQMQSLLVFPGVFGLVLALGIVHEASILLETYSADSYSLSLVWALHEARRHSVRYMPPLPPRERSLLHGSQPA